MISGMTNEVYAHDVRSREDREALHLRLALPRYCPGVERPESETALLSLPFYESSLSIRAGYEG